MFIPFDDENEKALMLITNNHLQDIYFDETTNIKIEGYAPVTMFGHNSLYTFFPLIHNGMAYGKVLRFPKMNLPSIGLAVGRFDNKQKKTAIFSCSNSNYQQILQGKTAVLYCKTHSMGIVTEVR